MTLPIVRFCSTDLGSYLRRAPTERTSHTPRACIERRMTRIACRTKCRPSEDRVLESTGLPVKSSVLAGGFGLRQVVILHADSGHFKLQRDGRYRKLWISRK